jgi:Flp pilus assembly pilin Flp
MPRLVSAAKGLVCHEEGASAVEYSLLIGLLAVAGVISIVLVSQYVRGALVRLESEIAASGGSS